MIVLFQRSREKQIAEADMMSSSLKLQELIKDRVGLENSAKLLSGSFIDIFKLINLVFILKNSYFRQIGISFGRKNGFTGGIGQN